MTTDTADRPVERRVQFGRRPQRGVLLGLHVPQLIWVGLALLVLVPSLYVGQFALAVATSPAWVPPLVLAFVSVKGRKLADWLPIVVSFQRRRRARQASFRKQQSKPRPDGTLALPGTAARLRRVVHDATGAVMVHDPHAKTLTATLRVIPGAWTLAEPAEQDRRADAWGALLSEFCTSDSGIMRVQVLERTLPESGVAAEAYWRAHGRDDDSWEVASYKQLLAAATPVSERHETTITLVLDIRAAGRAVKDAGGGVAGAAEVLAQQVGMLTSRLSGMDVRPDGCLDSTAMAGVLRGAYDPAALAQIAKTGVGTALERAGPVAVEEEWDHLRADSAFHCVLWVAEWPRLEVPVNFLWPLLLTSGVRRTVSTTFRPVPTAKALRTVRAELVDHESNARQRAKRDVIETESDRREWNDTRRREVELAAGAGDMDYAGLVVVSAWSLDELRANVGQITTAAAKAHCELRVLYGEQAEAFTAGALPLGRGLR
ncbi:putative type VII ESX secretion system EccE translocon [Haloactinopolyspora alba]|uniref:Putative type VII ESX secretion system EccE translocon n=1 Tax=Haloactinopolyspora alba TaxID=648780 RepID=A0A2P8EFD3_9ACTN|nr:SCO6880 family protein [Haloactinopolyspora alba]PSL08176.1 putative type VII ESX secretion system EccE translocon [Haloactinopolyspora alba]